MVGDFLFSFRLPAGKHFPHLSTPCGQLSIYAQLPFALDRRFSSVNLGSKGFS